MSAHDAFVDILDGPDGLDDLPWFIEPKDKDPTSELKRQQSFIALMARIAPNVDIVAIPNAGKATDWERVQRWKEGARAGALDLVITWEGGVAFAEFKNGTSMPTPQQRARLNLYFAMRHHTGVFRTGDCLVEFLRDRGAPFIDRRGL